MRNQKHESVKLLGAVGALLPEGLLTHIAPLLRPLGKAAGVSRPPRAPSATTRTASDAAISAAVAGAAGDQSQGVLGAFIGHIHAAMPAVGAAVPTVAAGWRGELACVRLGGRGGTGESVWGRPTCDARVQRDALLMFCQRRARHASVMTSYLSSRARGRRRAAG